MAPDSVWEIVFLMVILKIPIVYLCCIIYWAIKAEPKPEEGAAVTVEAGPDDGGGSRRRRRPPRFPRPHGSPTRRYPRTPAPAVATMRADEHDDA
jgi:hypothetical protein